MKNIWIVSLVVITAVLFSSCNEEKNSNEKKENTIIGKWENTNKKGSDIEFNSDGNQYYLSGNEYLTDSLGNKTSMGYTYVKINDNEFEVKYNTDPKYDLNYISKIVFLSSDRINIKLFEDTVMISEAEFHRMKANSK